MTRQVGTSNMCIPHRPLLPRKDCGIKFPNAPPWGISPYKSLNKILILLRCKCFSNDLGIISNKVFTEKSKISKHIMLAKDNGIGPANELFDRLRAFIFLRSPHLPSILPEKW